MRNPFVGIPSFIMAPMCFDLEELDGRHSSHRDAPTIWVRRSRGRRQIRPKRVREASSLNCYAHEGWYDPVRDETFLGRPWKIVDCGDIDVLHTVYERSFKNCEAAIRKILQRGDTFHYRRRSRHNHSDTQRIRLF